MIILAFLLLLVVANHSSGARKIVNQHLSSTVDTVTSSSSNTNNLGGRTPLSPVALGNILDFTSNNLFGVQDAVSGVDICHKINEETSRNSNGIEEEAFLSTQAVTTISSTSYYLRLSYLLLIFSPVFFTAPLAMLSSDFRRNVWYPLLVICLRASGPAFVKWAQWASTRPDLFPPALCQHMQILQTQALKHSARHTAAILQTELNFTFKNFDYFDVEPIASGSIAQVHRAVYKNQEIAVKIRHPNVKTSLAQDTRIMTATVHAVVQMVSLLERIQSLGQKASMSKSGNSEDKPVLRLQDTLRHFSASLAAQTDLRSEACNLFEFRKQFQSPLHTLIPRETIIKKYDQSSRSRSSGNNQHTADNVTNSYNSNNNNVVLQDKQKQQHVLKRRGEKEVEHFLSHYIDPIQVHIDFPMPLLATEALIFESFVSGRHVSSIPTPNNIVQHIYHTSHKKNGLVETLNTKDMFPYQYFNVSFLLDLQRAFVIVSQGEGLYLDMLLRDRFMHADLHPGNILFQYNDKYNNNMNDITNNEKTIVDDLNKMQLSLVDAGLVARLSVTQQRLFTGFLSALERCDGFSAALYMLSWSNEDDLTNIDPDDPIIVDRSTRMSKVSLNKCQRQNLSLVSQAKRTRYAAFIQAMTTLTAKFSCNNNYSENQEINSKETLSSSSPTSTRNESHDDTSKVSMRLSLLLREILQLVQQHRIHISGTYATLLINALCLDGLATQFLPTYNVLEGARDLFALFDSFERHILHNPFIRAVSAVFPSSKQQAKVQSNSQSSSISRDIQENSSKHERLLETLWQQNIRWLYPLAKHRKQIRDRSWLRQYLLSLICENNE